MKNALLSLRQNSVRAIPFIAIALLMLTTLDGCRVIGDIFKVGMWVGILFVVVILAIIWGIMKMFRR